MHRAQERFSVDFPVFLNWQDKTGVLRRTSAVCTDLSESGMKLFTVDRLERMQVVVVGSEVLGRLGHATIQYCNRVRMKNQLGLQFAVPFRLSDPARRRILEQVIRKPDSAPGLTGMEFGASYSRVR